MRQTALMSGRGELPIRRPAVADDHAGEVGAEQGRRLPIAPAGLDHADGRTRGRRDPQPLEPAADLPAGFVARGNRAVPNLTLQLPIGRPRLTGGAIARLCQPAATDPQAVVLLRECGNLAERRAQLLVDDGRPTRPPGCRVAPRRPRAHPRTAADADLAPGGRTPPAANHHLKFAHDHPRDPQLFVDLRGHTRRPAPRLFNPDRPRAVGRRTVCRPGTAATATPRRHSRCPPPGRVAVGCKRASSRMARLDDNRLAAARPAPLSAARSGPPAARCAYAAAESPAPAAPFLALPVRGHGAAARLNRATRASPFLRHRNPAAHWVYVTFHKKVQYK